MINLDQTSNFPSPSFKEELESINKFIGDIMEYLNTEIDTLNTPGGVQLERAFDRRNDLGTNLKTYYDNKINVIKEEIDKYKIYFGQVIARGAPSSSAPELSAPAPEFSSYNEAKLYLENALKETDPSFTFIANKLDSIKAKYLEDVFKLGSKPDILKLPSGSEDPLFITLSNYDNEIIAQVQKLNDLVINCNMKAQIYLGDTSTFIQKKKYEVKRDNYEALIDVFAEFSDISEAPDDSSSAELDDVLKEITTKITEASDLAEQGMSSEGLNELVSRLDTYSTKIRTAITEEEKINSRRTLLNDLKDRFGDIPLPPKDSAAPVYSDVLEGYIQGLLDEKTQKETEKQTAIDTLEKLQECIKSGVNRFDCPGISLGPSITNYQDHEFKNFADDFAKDLGMTLTSSNDKQHILSGIKDKEIIKDAYKKVFRGFYDITVVQKGTIYNYVRKILLSIYQLEF